MVLGKTSSDPNNRRNTKQRSSNVKMFCHEALPEPFSWMKDFSAFRLDEGYTKGYDIYDV